MVYDPNRPDYPSNNVGQDVDQIRINCNALREHERQANPPTNPVIGLIWRTNNLPSGGYVADAYYMYNKNSQWIFLFSDNDLLLYESKFQAGSNIYAVDSGTVNVYVVALSPAPTQYVEGMTIRFKASNTNTGASTLNVNSLGVKTIKKYVGGILLDLESNDIISQQIITVIYDGTYFQIILSGDNIRDNSITTPKIADAAISQNKLKTSMGTVSLFKGSDTTCDAHIAQALSSQNNVTNIYIQTASASSNLTLPGGGYGFYPQIRIPAGDTLYCDQRYVTASGKDHWIFILYDTVKKQIISIWEAPDHPCYGQGGDEIDIPHPFVDYFNKPLPVNLKIILVDNAILPQLKTKRTRNRSLSQIINEDYEIDFTITPIYQKREIIEIDEFGDRTGEIKEDLGDGRKLKRRMVTDVPSNIEYRQLKLK